jgi:hypothetical protein
MSIHDHHPWDIRVRITFQHDFDEQPVLQAWYGEEDPKPEIAHAAVFSPAFPSCCDGFWVFGHVILESFLDILRGQAFKVCITTDTLGSFLVPLTTAPKTTQDGLTDKRKLRNLIHQPPVMLPWYMSYVNRSRISPSFRLTTAVHFAFAVM